MTDIEPVFLNLAVALGIGLLIGAERERRKGSGPSRSPAGIRTFAIASLAGAISLLVGGETLLAIVTAGIIALIAIAYWRGREDDRLGRHRIGSFQRWQFNRHGHSKNASFEGLQGGDGRY